MASQKGLGRGLGALLGDMTEEPKENTPYQRLPIYKIEPNPNQPREVFDEEELEALAESIRLHGVIQPLTVREMPSGYYQIIAGERRWRASRKAGLSEVPAVHRRVEPVRFSRRIRLAEDPGHEGCHIPGPHVRPRQLHAPGRPCEE